MSPSNTSYAPAVAELALTLMVSALLALMAHPLGGPDHVFGLAGRYVEGAAGDIRGSQSVVLAQTLWWRIPLFAGAGWLALRLGRARTGRLPVVFFIAALWLAVFAALQQPLHELALGGALVAATAGFGLSWRRRQTTSGAIPHPFLYPGWVLFTGLGLIWLVDYSARAHFKWRYLALAHADAVLFAYAAMTVVAALATPIAGLLSRALAAADKAQTPTAASTFRRRMAPAMLALLFGLWCVLVVATFGQSRPAVSSELLRVPLFILGGWVLHRWATQGHRGRALQAATLVAAAVAAGFVGTGDFGQLLLAALALSIAAGTAVAAAIGGSRLAALGGVLVATAVMAYGMQAIYAYGHLVSRHIGLRAEALVTPFAGRLEYLSELRWFSAATPFWGHGLTQVPWCGLLAAVGGSSRCAGVPKEMHSDYVFSALSGVWGAWTAVFLTALLAAWLVSLVRVRVSARAAEPVELQRWIAVCFVAVALVQLLYSTLGGLGVVALTGVTYPLLGFGMSSLLVTAVFVGMAMRR